MAKSIENSQPHTIQGERGQQMVSLKDIQIAECFLRGMLDAATYYGKDNDYSPTEKLYYNDLIEIIYEVRWMENFDPVAIVQSACCHMEKAMGIYPNIPPLIEAKMKTCNGCDRLIQQVKIIWDGAYYFVDLCTFEISDNSFDRTFRVIGRHEKTVETPDWCPKKNENIQKEVSNVH